MNKWIEILLIGCALVFEIRVLFRDETTSFEKMVVIALFYIMLKLAHRKEKQ